MNLKSLQFLSLCILFFAVGCDEPAKPAKTPVRIEVPPVPEAEPSPPPAFETLLSGSARASADRERDAGRKPAEVIAYFGVKSGMTVIDLLTANGYYTEVLSLRVGDEGKVYAHNTAFMLSFRDGANDKAMSERLEGGRLANVERLDRELTDLGLAEGSVDFAITAMNFHDFYYNGGSDAVQGILAAVKAILKPGGVLGIIDHVGVAGADNSKLHRIEPEIVREEAQKAGFELDGESDLLANPEDSHDANVFGELRGRTDRFLFRLKKPGEQG
jgi:predicted methyltransferase